MTAVSLAEELLLLAYDDETGKPTGSQIGLDLGMAAAVLVELTLAGRIALAGAVLVVRDPTSTGEPIEDEVLARMAADTPHTPESWVQRLRHRLRNRVLADLVSRGVLRQLDETALEYIEVHRYPAVDASVEAEVRARLGAALTGEEEPDERTAALATLVAATRMEPALRLPPGEVEAAHRRLAEIANTAGFTGTSGMEDSTVRPSVALVIVALTAAIKTALGAPRV